MKLNRSLWLVGATAVIACTSQQKMQNEADQREPAAVKYASEPGTYTPDGRRLEIMEWNNMFMEQWNGKDIGKKFAEPMCQKGAVHYVTTGPKYRVDVVVSYDAGGLPTVAQLSYAPSSNTTAAAIPGDFGFGSEPSNIISPPSHPAQAEFTYSKVSPWTLDVMKISAENKSVTIQRDDLGKSVPETGRFFHDQTYKLMTLVHYCHRYGPQ